MEWEGKKEEKKGEEKAKEKGEKKGKNKCRKINKKEGDECEVHKRLLRNQEERKENRTKRERDRRMQSVYKKQENRYNAKEKE